MATKEELIEELETVKAELETASKAATGQISTGEVAQLISSAVGGIEGNNTAAMQFCSLAIECLKDKYVQDAIKGIIFTAVINKFASLK